MAACTSTIPDMNSWKLKRKSSSDYERLDSGKFRKTSNFVKENGFNKNQTSSFSKKQRPLSDITPEIQAQKSTPELDVDSSSEARDIVTVGSEKSVVESPTGDKTVTYVNNLFSPVNKLQAIPLSLDELRRRTEYPEYFGRSEMVAYLRHSKTTGNELIARFNLKPKSKRSHVNVLSRLCEREARTLANGIHQMNSEYFPTDYVADTMKKQMQGERVLNEEEQTEDGDDDATDSDNRETIKSTICMLQSLRKSLEEPDEELGKELEVFERATHTFGCQNILNHISFVESYLSELQKKL